MNLNEIFENNFDCYTEVHKGKCIEEEMVMTKGTFLEVVEHIIHQANGVDASTKTALPIQNVTNCNFKTVIVLYEDVNSILATSEQILPIHKGDALTIDDKYYMVDYVDYNFDKATFEIVVTDDN